MLRDFFAVVSVIAAAIKMLLILLLEINLRLCEQVMVPKTIFSRYFLALVSTAHCILLPVITKIFL